MPCRRVGYKLALELRLDVPLYGVPFGHYPQPQFPTNMHSTREAAMVYFAMYNTRCVPSRH